MITYFENHNPLRRPLNQPRRRPPNQPRRRSGRQDRKNGAVDLRHLDGVLQDLGFAPKPHPTIFTENQPNTVFDGLEKFQKGDVWRVGHVALRLLPVREDRCVGR